jgi:hypothetical protein
MKVHVLKSWPAFFEAQASGEKTFEVRRNDREFAVGDILILRKWDPESRAYVPGIGGPGVVGRRVTYLTSEWFLLEGFCAMSVVPLSTTEEWRAATLALAGVTQ